MKERKAQFNYLELMRLMEEREEFKFFCFHRCCVVKCNRVSEESAPLELLPVANNALALSKPTVAIEVEIYDLETSTSFFVTLRDPVFAGQADGSAKFLGVTARC